MKSWILVWVIIAKSWKFPSLQASKYTPISQNKLIMWQSCDSLVVLVHVVSLWQCSWGNLSLSSPCQTPARGREWTGGVWPLHLVWEWNIKELSSVSKIAYINSVRNPASIIWNWNNYRWNLPITVTDKYLRGFSFKCLQFKLSSSNFKYFMIFWKPTKNSIRLCV